MDGEWTQEDAEDNRRAYLHDELDNKIPPSHAAKFRVDFENYLEQIK
jgi:hypothetical protein